MTTSQRIRIDKHAISLLAKLFNTHKKGLPEWLKNSREGYLRYEEYDSRESRIIVINYKRAKDPRNSCVECIDFAGISGADIDSDYLVWATPDAAQKGVKRGEVEGGQGNGGKGYLRQLFSKGYFISICNEKLSAVSFLDLKKYLLDFVPNEEEGKDVEGDCPSVPNFRRYAANWLKEFSLGPTHNITIVRGEGPLKSFEPDELMTAIQQFPQARHTIESCRVLYYEDGAFKRELRIQKPPLHPQYPDPIKIAIPDILDVDGKVINTTKNPKYGAGELQLCVSAKPLSGQALSSWNRIEFYGASSVRNIGSKLCEEFALTHPHLGKYLFGRCQLPLLVDPEDDYEIQGRVSLNEGPLSKALYDFIAGEANKVLEMLEKQVEGQQQQKMRKNLEKLHERLVSWIESKLSALKGLGGDDVGPGKPPRKPRVKKLHGPAISLAIHKQTVVICKGVEYQLRPVSYDAERRPAVAGKLVWRSQAPNIVSVHPDKGTLLAVSSGLATVTVSTIDGRLNSQPAIVQVHEAAEIEILGKFPLKLGTNRKCHLETRVRTTDERTIKNPILQWKSNDQNVIQCGPDGWISGGAIGEAEVSANAEKAESTPVEIEVDQGAGGDSKGGGKGKPQIKLSGYEGCPFDGSPVWLQESDPAVYQRPGKPDYDFNVFWINMQHPLAVEIYKYGEGSIQWRSYHFQRIVDVFLKLEMRSRMAENQELSVDDVLEEIDVVTSAIYVDAKDDLIGLLCDEKMEF